MGGGWGVSVACFGDADADDPSRGRVRHVRCLLHAPMLAQGGVLDLHDLAADLAQDLQAPAVGLVQVGALGREVRALLGGGLATSCLVRQEAVQHRLRLFLVARHGAVCVWVCVCARAGARTRAHAAEREKEPGFRRALSQRACGLGDAWLRVCRVVGGGGVCAACGDDVSRFGGSKREVVRMTCDGASARSALPSRRRRRHACASLSRSQGRFLSLSARTPHNERQRRSAPALLPL